MKKGINLLDIEEKMKTSIIEITFVNWNRIKWNIFDDELYKVIKFLEQQVNTNEWDDNFSEQ